MPLFHESGEPAEPLAKKQANAERSPFRGSSVRAHWPERLAGLVQKIFASFYSLLRPVAKATAQRRRRDNQGNWKSSGSFSRNEIPLGLTPAQVRGLTGTRARDGDVRLVLFLRSGSPLFWTSRLYVANDGAGVIG